MRTADRQLIRGAWGDLSPYLEPGERAFSLIAATAADIADGNEGMSRLLTASVAMFLVAEHPVQSGVVMESAARMNSEAFKAARKLAQYIAELLEEETTMIGTER